MKKISCPKCDPGKFGFPILQSADRSNLLKCPVCREIFDKNRQPAELKNDEPEKMTEENLYDELWNGAFGV